MLLHGLFQWPFLVSRGKPGQRTHGRTPGTDKQNAQQRRLGFSTLGEGVRFHCQLTTAAAATLSKQLTFKVSREQTFSSCPFIKTRWFGKIKQKKKTSNREYLHLGTTKKSFKASTVSKANFILSKNTNPTIKFNLLIFFSSHSTVKFGYHPSTTVVFGRSCNFSFHSCSYENCPTVTAEWTLQGFLKQSYTRY